MKYVLMKHQKVYKMKLLYENKNNNNKLVQNRKLNECTEVSIPCYNTYLKKKTNIIT